MLIYRKLLLFNTFLLFYCQTQEKSDELLASRHTPSDIQGIEFQGNAVGAAGAVPTTPAVPPAAGGPAIPAGGGAAI